MEITITTRRGKKAISGASYGLRGKEKTNKTNDKSTINRNVSKAKQKTNVQRQVDIVSTTIRRQKKQINNVSTPKSSRETTAKNMAGQTSLSVEDTSKKSTKLPKPIREKRKSIEEKRKLLTSPCVVKLGVPISESHLIEKNKPSTPKKSAEGVKLIMEKQKLLTYPCVVEMGEPISESQLIEKNKPNIPEKSGVGVESIMEKRKILTSPCVVRLGKPISESQLIEENKPTTPKKSAKEVQSILEKRRLLTSPCVVRLSKRIENLNKKPEEKNKKSSRLLNKSQTIVENKETMPIRLLRKRNWIPNQYKDLSLDSPVIKKSDEKASVNPLSVYDFDGSEESTEEIESETSDEEIKMIVNRMKKAKKKSNNRRKIATKMQASRKKLNDQTEKQVMEQSTEITDSDQRQLKTQTSTSIKQLKKQITETIDSGTKQMIVETSKTIDVESKRPTETKQAEKPQLCSNNFENVSPSYFSDPIDPISETDAESVKPSEKKQIEIPPIVSNEVEIVSLSSSSDPIEPISVIDPSIQARNLIKDLTKSFIEDLSDEGSQTGPKSNEPNVYVRKPRQDQNKIFNSTLNGLKPEKPWRIDVSVVKKRPEFFTYKDKSFTPRYEPEILFDINKALERKDPKENPKIVKPTQQTSILDFVRGNKLKSIENKPELFSNIPTKVQSPRKVLGEINFVQSTPLKVNNLNVLKVPDLSFINPPRKSDGMFGFSFASEEENKENNPQSPEKKRLKPRLRHSPRKVKFVDPKTSESNKNEFNRTSDDTQTENSNKQDDVTIGNENTEPFENNDISVHLFEDNVLEVSKKSNRKYVRKNPKRRRLPSFNSNYSSEDSEPELPIPKKKKNKNAMTDAEEKEADKLASFYNSMFEEIEKHQLIIE